MPFATVGGGLGRQPDKMLRWFGRVVGGNLPHIYEQALKNLNLKEDIYLKYMPRTMVLAYLLKAVGISASLKLPSTAIGQV